MILHNTTFAADQASAPRLVEFLREIYVPAATERGLQSPLIYRLRETENPQAHTYAVQMQAETQCAVDRFQQHLDNVLGPRLFADFGYSVALFTSLLDSID